MKIVLTVMLIFPIFLPAQHILEIQGHRGYRGVMPENTIVACTKALEIGVQTLELDLVISKDHEVVVSHEPYFSHLITTGPNGAVITKKTEKQHNLYQLKYNEIEQYDVGLKPYAKFPEQEKVPAKKPLLKALVKHVESFAKTGGLKTPQYNLEIKRRPRWDGLYHPPVREFVELVLDQVKALQIEQRTCIQSFDTETLQIVKELAPGITVALLVDNLRSVQSNLKRLGFTPEIYSPNYRLVRKATLNACREHRMRLIPWTVNREKHILKMLRLQVDGLITDYPGRVLAIVKNDSGSGLQ